MSADYDITETLDVKGASCPMPVVKTKSAIDDLAEGEILEVLATDSGSMSDIDGWASGTRASSSSTRRKATTCTSTTSARRSNDEHGHTRRVRR